MSACCDHVDELTGKIHAIIKGQSPRFVSLEVLVLHCHICSSINVIPTGIVEQLADLDTEVERGYGEAG